MTHPCKIKRRGERGRRERGEGRRENLEEKQKPREWGREERGRKYCLFGMKLVLF